MNRADDVKKLSSEKIQFPVFPAKKPHPVTGCGFFMLKFKSRVERPLRQADDLAALECGLVGEDAGAGDVCALDGVRIGIDAGLEHFHELMNEVRMTSAVARALGEGKVLLAAFAA